MISGLCNPGVWVKMKAQETRGTWKARWNAMCHVKYFRTLMPNDYWWNNKIRARIHQTKSVLSSHGKISYYHKVKLELWLIRGVLYRFKRWWGKKLNIGIPKIYEDFVFRWENILKTSWAARMGKSLDITGNGVGQRTCCQHSSLR